MGPQSVAHRILPHVSSERIAGQRMPIRRPGCPKAAPMIAIRIALTVLIAASIAQLALARTEPASRPQTTSVAVDNSPIDEQMCELQRCITLHHLPGSARFDSAPRVLDPFLCQDR